MNNSNNFLGGNNQNPKAQGGSREQRQIQRNASMPANPGIKYKIQDASLVYFGLLEYNFNTVTLIS